MANEAEGNETISKFYFTKNRNFLFDDVDYLNALCDLLNSCPSHCLSSSLQDLILQRCRQKIISRLVKLQKTVKELQESIPSWDQPSQEDVDEFSQVFPTAPGMTRAQILWSFLYHGLEPDQFASSNRPKPLFQVLLFFKKGFYLRSLQLTRRVRKVSAYAAIITRITKMGSTRADAKNLSSESCESSYPSARPLKFITSQLPSPPRIMLPPIPSLLTLINESARALEPPMDRFKIQDIKAGTPSTVRDGKIQNMRSNIEAFVHCECALAVAMRQLTSEPLEIDVSKNCCLLCTIFLKESSKETDIISLSAFHDKTCQSWLFPLEQSHSIYRKMEDLARDDFKLLLIALNGRRISDSHGSSSDDDDDDDDDDFEPWKRTVAAMK